MGTDTTPDLAKLRPELAKTLALMRLMSATGETVHLSGPALADVLAEVTALRARLAELEAGETRTEWGAKWRSRDEAAEAAIRAWQELQPRAFVMPAQMTELAIALAALVRAHGETTESETTAELAGRDGDTTHA